MKPEGQAKILELFKSVQGEGQYAGVQQVFVRFFECNMHCVWCDTPHSIGDTSARYKEYNINALWTEIIQLWPDCHSVSLTGGEPLLQKDFIKTILPKFKQAGMPVHLETNGVFPEALQEVIDGVDVIAMDIKLPSSTECQPFWDEHTRFLNIARQKEVFIKTVISSATEKEDIIKAAELTLGVDPNILFILQPNTYDLSNGVMNKCLDFQKECVKTLTNVRIIPQMHKMLKIK